MRRISGCAEPRLAGYRSNPLPQLRLHLKLGLSAYVALICNVDAVVFTGGIGYNASVIQERASQGVEHLGIVVQGAMNIAALGNIAKSQKEGAPVKGLVFRTDKDREIIQQTVLAIQKAK